MRDVLPACCANISAAELAAPVEAIQLVADEVVAKPGASAPLFAEAVAVEGALRCLERLQARLGPGAVQVLGAAADYRPECATRRRAAVADFAVSAVSTAGLEAARPLLLPAMQAPASRRER